MSKNEAVAAGLNKEMLVLKKFGVCAQNGDPNVGCLTWEPSPTQTYTPWTGGISHHACPAGYTQVTKFFETTGTAFNTVNGGYNMLAINAVTMCKPD